jgi:hypothetical protein
MTCGRNLVILPSHLKGGTNSLLMAAVRLFFKAAGSTPFIL